MQTVRFSNRRRTPSKILCIGRNYLEHVQELNNAVPDEMVVFIKPNASISEHLHAVHHSEPLHYETEICFLIKQGRYHAVGLGFDLTKRAVQSRLKDKGLPWERAKSFSGAAVFSRFIPLKNIEIQALSLELYINGVRIQQGDVTQMMFSPDMILQELQTFTTLEDDDVIMTGTPKGVGLVQAGDLFLARLKHHHTILIEAEWQAI